MFFLPIVQRELRAASRRKNTHRVRLWTTAAAVIVAAFIMLASPVSGPFMRNPGQTLFNLLTWYVFILSLLAGVVLAADCISEEKREGTLGLLFLTDLKGYDVVLGKLAVVGLTSLYGLVAVLPVIGLPLLLGGVTGTEFARTALALLNALFFSLAVGIFVSTLSRRANAAVSTTLTLILLLTFGLAFAGAILSVLPLPASLSRAISFGPYTVFKLASGTGSVVAPDHYWFALAASHGFAWLLVVVASLALPHTWQERQVKQEKASFARMRSSLSPARRAKLLEQNPILWLAGNETGTIWIWAVTAVFLGGAGYFLILRAGYWSVAPAFVILGMFQFMLKIFMAIHASRFFAEARRGGGLEMLASTPLGSKDLIAGQWLVLKRMFLWPAILLVSLQLVLLSVSESGHAGYRMPGFTGFRLMNGTLRYTSMMGPLSMMLLPIRAFNSVEIVYQMLRWVADMAALGWMGMWMGLSSKKPSLAAGKTILYVMVLPYFAVCVPNILFDIVFITYARDKLRCNFRGVVLPEYHPIDYRPARPGSTPPVIRAR